MARGIDSFSRQARDMSRRCGSSRALGPVKQCAIYVRSGVRCAWCRLRFEGPADASVDHLDADSTNNDSTNLIAACRVCNRLRQIDWAPAHWSRGAALSVSHTWLAPRLIASGTSLAAACRRIARQRCRLLDLPAGKALAHKWHGTRMLAIAEHGRQRNANRLAGRWYERAEREALTTEQRYEEAWNEVFGS
jgi:hypothetical protein